MTVRITAAWPTRHPKTSRPATERWYRPQFETLESRHLLSVTSMVVNHEVFYNNSAFDGTPGISPSDDSAIALDKDAYLPGSGPTTAANITSYSRGINGLMVDISGSHPNISADDFIFKMGTSNTPATWAPAPAPSAVTVRPGAGDGGSDRVEIIWNDNAIQNTWLQVIVAAGDDTGLATANVFYYGNRIGDTFSDAQPTYVGTDATDEIEARNHQGIALSTTNLYDFNRDFSVDATDQIIARSNGGFMAHTDILLTLPALAAALAVDTGPDATPNSDGITTDPTIQGTLTAGSAIASFKAGLNAGPVTFNALGELSGSNFTLDQAFLESMNGGPLADGAYVVHLQAVDADGLSAAAEVAFTLKTSIPTPAIPDLIAADDTGASSSDNITKINTPRIDVAAETGSLVRIYVDGSPVDTGTGAPGLQFLLSTLSDGVHNIHIVAQDGAGNSATSPMLPITVSTALPTVSASTIATLSADLTPHVTVAASGPLGLANGTQVTLDVDLDYDGNFAGAGEVARTTSTLYNGGSYFQLTPALPHDMSGAAYNVQLRARVTDIAGNEGTSTPIQLTIDSIGNTVLEDYVNAFDPTYNYSLFSTVPGAGYTLYNVDMDSQTWRSAADVNKPVWQHWVQFYVPTGAITGTATLLIDGGNNSGSPPGVDSGLAALSVATGSVVVRLRNVPNEPLQFTDEGFTRREDAIIAYTFDKYANHLGDPGNETWPLLLPMVKSAMAAMDTAQSFIPTVKPGETIDDFLVTGYSKRGWTTWLTAAMDDRVRAIVPGVIDVLNMGEQMVHHYNVYGGFSFAIGDYTAYNIPQESFTTGGQELARVVDPYSYLNNGRFDDLPKLMINSAGDEFFVSDSAQYYFSDIPGTQNYLRYIPNTGHGLNNTDPANSTLSFFDAVVNGTPLPQYSWTVDQNGDIIATTTSSAANVTARLWQGTNPSARDFRNSVTGVTWTSSVLSETSPGSMTYVGNVPVPGSGATAYFIELTFDNPSANPLIPDFVFTTEIRVATNIPLVPWAFYMPAIPLPAPPPGESGDAADALVAGDLDGVAAALAAPREADAAASAAPLMLAPSAPATSSSRADDVDRSLADTWSWTDDDSETAEEEDELALLLLGDDWL